MGGSLILDVPEGRRRSDVGVANAIDHSQYFGAGGDNADGHAAHTTWPHHSGRFSRFAPYQQRHYGCARHKTILGSCTTS